MTDAALSLNLAQVIYRVETHPNLPVTRRKELKQAVQKVCRWLGQTPETVSARRIDLRVAIEGLNASQLGIKSKTLKNTISALNSALSLCADGTYRNCCQTISENWLVLIETIEPEWRAQKIQQLARYASHVGIDPADVTARTFANWLDWRQTHAPLLAKPGRAVEDAWSTWNWLAKSRNDWPTDVIAKQRQSKRRRLERSTLHPDLIAELDAYEARMTRNVVECLLPEADLDPVNVVVPKVARNRILAIELCATALIETGKASTDDLSSIASIVSAEHANVMIGWVLKDRPGQYTHYHRTLLEHLRSVAAQYLSFDAFDDGNRERLRFNHMIKVVSDAIGHGQMTLTNKRRLKQFDDPENIARIVNLPDKIFSRLETRRHKTGVVTCAMAYDARAAIAILILMTLPLRRTNLTELRVGKELILPTNRREPAQIMVDAASVKNTVDLACLIPQHARDLIELYIRWYRPVLIAGKKSSEPGANPVGDGDHYLLPIKGGDKPIDGVKLREKIVDLVKKETGLEVTTHFFRHLMGSLMLRANPALADAAGNLLGHKSGSRVTKLYADLPTARAASTLEEVKDALARPRRRSAAKPRSSRIAVRRSHVR